MENKERQILSEMMAMLSSLRNQLDALEAKVEEFQQMIGNAEEDMTPIDLDIDDIQEIEMVEEVEAVETVDDDLPFDDVPVPELAVESESAVESEPVVETEDDLPVFAEPLEEMPEPVMEIPVAEQVSVVEPKPAVIDSMTDRQAWRTDMPGSQVRDIRSAISLNDRILFINTLFNQDPMAFQDTLTRINQMETLDEVISYVAEVKPEWSFESEVVYRFMMAVRRKVR